MVPSENLKMKYNEKVTDCNMRVQTLKTKLSAIQKDVCMESVKSSK